MKTQANPSKVSSGKNLLRIAKLLAVAVAAFTCLTSCDTLNDPETRQVIYDSLQQGFQNADDIINGPPGSFGLQ